MWRRAAPFTVAFMVRVLAAIALCLSACVVDHEHAGEPPTTEHTAETVATTVDMPAPSAPTPPTESTPAPSGPTGVSAETGESGTSGVTGPTALTGPSGQSGTSGPTGHTGSVGPCPVPAAGANEVVIYGDATLSHWTADAWGSTISATSATTCSGTSALTYSPGQYEGAQFYDDAAAEDVDATVLRYRIWVDRAVTISAAAAPSNNSADIHAYFLQPSSAWTLKPGWNEMEFQIPTVLPPVPPGSPWTWTAGAPWGKTGHILFERQSCDSASGSCASVTVVLDDVRLVK
jgi:hypothetical protein